MHKIFFVLKFFIVFASATFFIVDIALASNAPKITWIPEKIETSVFQGGARTISVNFKSSEDISSATVWIVPELKPFITVRPDNTSLIKAGEEVSLLATIKIPKTQPIGVIEGTIHLRLKNKTIAKPLPIKIGITSPEIVELKIEEFLIQQFGTTTPEIPSGQRYLFLEPPPEILNLVSANSNLSAVFKVGSVIFSHNLIPDDWLKAAGFDLLLLLKTKGVKIDEWNNYLFSNLWHVDDLDDPILPQSVDATMLQPGPWGLPSWIYYNGHIIVILDSNTHIIMKSADTESLYVKNYLDATGNLTDSASTAFHELFHVFNFRTGCGGSSWFGSDNEGDYVALMETFLKHLFQGLDSRYLTSEINFIISNYPNSYSCLDQLYLTPPAPSTLSYSDLTFNSVKLNWTKNEDLDFSRYELYRITSLEPEISQIIVASDDPNFTFFTDTNLMSNTQYWYQLKTYDKAGLFSSSDRLALTTPAKPYQPFQSDQNTLLLYHFDEMTNNVIADFSPQNINLYHAGAGQIESSAPGLTNAFHHEYPENQLGYLYGYPTFNLPGQFTLEGYFKQIKPPTSWCSEAPDTSSPLFIPSSFLLSSTSSPPFYFSPEPAWCYWQMLFSIDQVSSHQVLRVYLDENNNLQLAILAPGGYGPLLIAPGSKITLNQWHYFIITHDGVNTLKTYLDNQLTGTFTFPAFIPPSGSAYRVMAFGQSSYEWRFYQNRGLIDEWRFSDINRYP